MDCPNCEAKLGDHEINIEACMSCGRGFMMNENDEPISY